jgi:DNA polymerase (family 10)
MWMFRMDNITIANFFHEIADILELKGEDPFRIGAYQRAAQTIESLTQNLEDISKEGKLREIPGIGESIAQKIEEILKTGKLKFLEDLRKTISPGLVTMLGIPGLGPKTILKLNKKFGIETLEDLEKLLPLHKICKLEGFGEKSEENIKKGLEQFKRHKERSLLGKVEPQGAAIVEVLKKVDGVDRVDLGGSIRRMKETIGDIDLLCTSTKPKKVIEAFCSLPQVKEVRAKGTTKAVVILKTGLEADLRVVEPEAYGAALHYFTGNKEHNIRIRTLGVKRGLKINEYGIFRIGGQSQSKRTSTIWDCPRMVRIGGRTEEEVFKAVGLPYIEPELRENRGEIEAGFAGKLPHLIELSDIKGDLHVHTNYSDGREGIEEIAEAAIKKGYQYIAITDHTKTVGITGGMDEKKILKQMKEIDGLNSKFEIRYSPNSKFTILKGVECDIKSDGTLDLPDKILEKLDVVVAAIHSKFGMDQTERLIKTCQNPHVDIIAHPTGRKLGERDPYQVDLDKVMDVCKKTNTFLELNAFWDRLDLNDVNCRKAKEKGVKIAIGTDTHHLLEMDVIKFGLATARRGWLEKNDVINTLPVEKLFS